jgi:diguanylate cyclase (GGDEF)-like protein
MWLIYHEVTVSNRGKSVRRSDANIRSWQVWSLSEPLRSFVVIVPILAVVAAGLTISVTGVRARDLAIFCALVGCGIITIEVTVRAVAREPQGTIIRDLLTVWYLAIAISLPPAYALLAPVPLAAFRLWRTQRTHVYRRVFSNATLSLGYGGAAFLMRSFPASISEHGPGTGVRLLEWVGAVALCGALAWVINNALLIVAMRLSDPEASLFSLIASREGITADAVELSLAVSATLMVALNPLLVAMVVPSMAMYRRYLMHAQLVSQSRTDGKTGLLNAAAWEREAAAEVARSMRTRTPLAVAILDLDKFKLVNDTYGHMSGDTVLREVARSLRSVLREYDQAGRFGGEEFAVLLPQTRAVDAFRVAERLRAAVAALTVPDSTAGDGTCIPVTVSIGVAALDAGSKRELPDLLAAADAALYRAKSAGRDQVQMISTTRGLSAIRPPAGEGREAQLDGTSSTASIFEPPLVHAEASPLRRTSGVG